MKKTVYIFRHGETDANAQKRMQGWLDTPLNSNGVAQAHALAKKLADVRFDCVYSSPLSRALDTARAVVGDDIEITTADDLREWNMGDFCGHIVRLTDSPADMPIDMSGDVIYAPYALLSNDDYVPPNGESYNMFVARVRDALLDIVKNSDGNTIAIATHTGVAKNIIKQFTDIKWPRGGMPNAEYLKLEYDGEKFTLIDMPDWLSPVLLGTDGKPLTMYHG
ncbi:MAG: histidine phosphatase family protein, partial [Pseudomonadota bacterium]|nr:histidine phosphatase family protein [Pseudomonadota bacterium]